jgi:hypothetical protein
MLNQQPAQAGSEPDRFHALCAELEEYEHLPELIPGDRSARFIADQNHEEAIDESILAGLTQP